MKKLTLLCLLLGAVACLAQTPPSKPGEIITTDEWAKARETGKLYRDRSADPFAAGDLTVGLFATARAKDIDSFSQLADDHEAGGGLEFGYSFTRNLSLTWEIHGMASRARTDFMRESGLTLSYGIPIGNVKPYALAGAGYDLVSSKFHWNSYAGGGLEVAISGKLRAFADGRHYLTGHDGVTLVRLGLRRGF